MELYTPTWPRGLCICLDVVDRDRSRWLHTSPDVPYIKLWLAVEGAGGRALERCSSQPQIQVLRNITFGQSFDVHKPKRDVFSTKVF